MAIDLDAGPPQDAHRHDASAHHGHAHGKPHQLHSVPHGHGGDTRNESARTAKSPGQAASYAPALSLLRLSTGLRLGGAVILTAIIWAAMHWATL